jgi:hypothetical protein
MVAVATGCNAPGLKQPIGRILLDTAHLILAQRLTIAIGNGRSGDYPHDRNKTACHLHTPDKTQ